MEVPKAEAMVRELQELAAKHPMVRVDIPIGDAFALIAELQIALRHPRNNGHPRAVAQQFKEALATAFETSPILAQVITLGDNPRFDS